METKQTIEPNNKINELVALLNSLTERDAVDKRHTVGYLLVSRKIVDEIVDEEHHQLK